jgi:hypothetical protein
MIIRFTTESGTIYECDKDLMTWCKMSTTSKSGITRSVCGHLIKWPKITVGQGAMLFDTDVKPGMTHHCVYTSDVIKVWEVEL